LIGLGFDLSQTLLEDRGLGPAALADLASRYDVRPFSEHELSSAYQLLRERLDGGNALDSAVHEALTMLLGSIASVADAGREFILAQKRAIPTSVIAYPDVSDVLGTLKEWGIPTAVLANGWYGLEVAKAAHIGFDGPVVVPPRAYWKPSRDAYVTLARSLALPPERVWYVSASQSDAMAAREAGMQSICVDRTSRPLSSIFETIGPVYTRSALALRQLLISKYQ
jgi:FMN phosphatase YigB (HAD superfamily)